MTTTSNASLVHSSDFSGFKGLFCCTSFLRTISHLVLLPIYHASIKALGIRRSVLFVFFCACASMVHAQTSFSRLDERPFNRYEYFGKLEEPQPRNNPGSVSTNDSVLKFLGRWPWGPGQAVAVAGNYAYISNGSMFQVLDISNDTLPRVIAEYVTYAPTDIQLRDNLAFVCSRESLLVLNVANPERPARVGWITFRSSTDRVRLVDSLAFVLGYGGTLYAVDISDPTAPSLRGQIPAGGIAPAIFTTLGRYVYAGEYFNFIYLDIVNATNPDSMWKVHTAWPLAPLCGTTTDSLLLMGSGGVLRVYDIRNPLLPEVVGNFYTADNVSGIVVRDSVAYLASGNSVYSVDISDPARPRMRSVVSPMAPVGSNATSMITESDKRVLASYNVGVFLIDASNPDSLRGRAYFPTGGSAERICLKDSLALIASGQAGLWIVDVSDPSRPRSMSNMQTGGSSFDVVASGNYAYFVNYPVYSESDPMRGLWIADVSNPLRPTIVSHYVGIVHYTGSGPNRIAKSGDLVFICQLPSMGNDSVLEIIDVSNVAEPERVTVLRGGYRPYDIAVKDSILFIAASDSGLIVLDVHNPVSPVRIGNVHVDARAVTVYDTLVVVGGSQLLLISVARPDSPYVLGSVPSFGGNGDIAVSGSFAYWASFARGGVVDISNPRRPILLTTFRGGSGVAAQRNTIFYAAGNTGVWIWRNDYVTSIDSPRNDGEPREYQLFQNYPNPFNGETVIQFFSVLRAHCNIEIYNILGQKVATLFDEIVDPGGHRVVFAPRGLSSGVYFYRLQTEARMMSKVMMYLK
jgi:hypothetical protein